MKTKQLQKYACSIWHRRNNVQQVNLSKNNIGFILYIFIRHIFQEQIFDVAASHS